MRRQQSRRSPLQIAYWEDKRANIKNINIPTYVVASYPTFVHTQGSIRGWLDVDTQHKWLRWDPYQEWFDLWAVKESRDELAAFFDKFLKGKGNGFKKVPRVRMALLQYGNKDPIYPIVEDTYPIPRTKYTSYYLGPDNSLSLSPPPESGSASYLSELTKNGFESVQFTYIHLRGKNYACRTPQSSSIYEHTRYGRYGYLRPPPEVGLEWNSNA